MGLFDLLPLLDGWDYHLYTVEYHTIVKGSPQIKLKLEKPGWAIQWGLATTDAFGTVLLKVKGPGGTEHTGILQPEAGRITGFLQTDPSGYVTLYNRPIPASTAGLYVLSVSPGASGSPFPVIGEVTIETYLEAGSTQNAALLTFYALAIEIKDKKAFLESLKKFQVGGLI